MIRHLTLADRHERRPSLRRVLAGVIAALSILSAGVLGSSALFSDSEVTPTGSAAFGTVDLTAGATSIAMPLSGMAPGDRVIWPVAVRNAGSLGLRYAITSRTPDDALISQTMQMEIRTGVTDCTAAGYAGTGASVYGPDRLGSAAGLPVVGDKATGPQAGDRALTAGQDETLCVRFTLPLSAPNTVQGTHTAATLIFDAEQTANNGGGAPPVQPTLPCTAVIQRDQWTGGWNVYVTVTAGPTALTQWKVTATLPAGATLNNAWNATPSAPSGTITFTSLAHTGILAANASYNGFGFSGTGTGPTTATCVGT